MSPGETPMILLVDDDRDHNQALAKTLERAGYRVITAGDVSAALSILRVRSCDAVITDLRMPRQSGLELLQSIRALRPQLPVVVLTVLGDWTSYVQAMDAGAVDYLTKPVGRQDLLTTLRKVLARRGLRAPDVPPSNSEENERTPV